MKIRYISQDEFELSYRAEIYVESEELIQNHLWWNEPLTLFDRIEYPLHLTGESELVRDTLNDEYGVRRVIPRKDDIYLALVDYSKMIQVLETLSKNHEITWRLFYPDDGGRETTIGYIVNGKSDAKVIQFIVDTLDRYHLSQDELWDTDLKNEVYSRYFDEEDNPIYDA